MKALICTALLLAAVPTQARGPALDDGAANAPTGTIPAPGLFTQGTGTTGVTYTARPPWRVAGVDYYVGYDAVAYTAKDPATIPVSGCVTANSANKITIGANGPCTIEGYNFGLNNGAWYIQVTSGCTSGTVTIRNNKFLMNTSWAGGDGNAFISANGDCPTVIENNVLDANGCVAALQSSPLTLGSIISATGKDITVRYNQMLNGQQHGVASAYSGAGIGSFVMKYNYNRTFGMSQDSHSNPGQIFGFASKSYNVYDFQYNTIVLPTSSGSHAAVGACAAFSSWTQGSGGSSGLFYGDVSTSQLVFNQRVDHNTLIAEPRVAAEINYCSYLLRVQTTTGTTPPAGPVYSPSIRYNYLADGTLADATCGSGISNNFVPRSNSTADPPPGMLLTPQWTNNINMLNGNPCNGITLGGANNTCTANGY